MYPNALLIYNSNYLKASCEFYCNNPYIIFIGFENPEQYKNSVMPINYDRWIYDHEFAAYDNLGNWECCPQEAWKSAYETIQRKILERLSY